MQSASIDVVTTASPYEEERTQYSVGLDYLHDRWTMNIGFTNSEENDYVAETMSFGISQDIFGDLTTISLGYSKGDDIVGRRGDPTFKDTVQRQDYRLGVSQILTKNLLLGLSSRRSPTKVSSTIRIARSATSTQQPAGLQLRARDLSAHSHERRGRDARCAITCRGARRSTASIVSTPTPGKSSRAHYEIGYTHPVEPGWIFEGKLRFYSQDKADFYSDLFPRSQFQNFMARDKELSTFASQSVRLGATYDIVRGGWKFVERGTVNVIFDHILFDYEDFRDLTGSGAAPGTEPLYSFDANVLQVFVSFWF